MGFVFLECLEAKQYYICRFCGVELVDMKELAVPDSAAFLFAKVVNVFLDQEKDLQLFMGRYTLAHAFCCNCSQPIGWRYVRAHDERQSHKNGLYHLDRRKLTRIGSGLSSG